MSSSPVTYATRRPQRAPCLCCGRKMLLTFHHLIPRKLHRRPRFRKHYSREELARGIYICRDCHDATHRTYTEMELAQELATPETLVADPDLARHFAFLSRQRRRPA